MVRKIFRTGNSLVVSLPKQALESLGLGEGSEVNVTVLPAGGCIIIEPVSSQLAGIEVVFAQQINDFIEQYRPALEALAK